MPHSFAITSVLSMDHITWAETGERVTVGSCGYYAAMALAHLGAGVLYAGAHGTDFDPALVVPLRSIGAEVVLCPLPGANARLDLVYDAAGEATYVRYDEASGTAFSADHLPAAFWEASYLWLGTAPHAFHHQVVQRRADKPVYLSTQGEYRNGGTDLLALAPNLTGIFSNTREIGGFGLGSFAQTIRLLRERNPHLTLLITQGAQGAYLLLDGTIYHVPAAPCPHLVNTTGAGDTFAAAWLLKMSQGKPPEHALAWAAAASALQMRGYAYTAQPSAPEVDAYLPQYDLPVKSFALTSPSGQAWLDRF